MPYASDAERAVIADDAHATRNQRLAAVWAHAKDVAAARMPEDRVMGHFTPPLGNRLMAELQAMPEGTRVEAMLAAARQHLGITEEQAGPSGPAEAGAHE